MFKERISMKEETTTPKKLLSPKGAIVCCERNGLKESRVLEKVVCSCSAGFCFFYDLLKCFFWNSGFSGKS